MAIEDEKKLVLSRRIATIWVVIAMFVAVLIGLVGYGMTCAGAVEFLDSPSRAEEIIIKIANLISQHGILAAIVAGLILAGILAATMSTADSQMLAAASSVSQNIIQDFFKVKLDEKKSLLNCLISCKGSEFQCIPYRKLCMGGIWRCIRSCYALLPVLEEM